MEATRILYVINQNSGKSGKSDLEDIVGKLRVNNEYINELYFITGNDDIGNIRKKIDEFSPQIVVAAGGDGTLNLVASVILGMPLKFGVIPLGSANGLAAELGIPGKIDDALQLILTGTARPMDVIRVNDNNISLHLSDLGINARIVKEFEKEGKRGLMGYAKHFFRELISPQKSFRCLINIEGRTFIHKAYMTIIANASSYSTGAVMNPRGKIDDGKFEIVVMKPHRRWVWRSLIGAFTGTLDRQPHIETYECESAVIRIIPGQELQVDGEILGKYNEVKASIYKHALHVILA